MMGYETILLWAIGIIVALSGWGTFLHTITTSKPKIKGQIFNVMTGTMPNPGVPNQTLTILMVYLYLTNQRKNTVHVLDYELEVDIGRGYERVKRFYGIKKSMGFSFASEIQNIEIPDLPEKLIYAKEMPAEYGIPLHGFVLFGSEMPLNQYVNKVKRFKVTCIDAFQGRHEIESSPNKFPNLYLLQDIAGIKITPKN